MHPEIDYALVDAGDRYLVLAEALVESCLARYQREGKVVATAKGEALELINFRHPFYERLSPVYLADYVASMPAPVSSTRRRPTAKTTSIPASATG